MQKLSCIFLQKSVKLFCKENLFDISVKERLELSATYNNNKKSRSCDTRVDLQLGQLTVYEKQAPVWVKVLNLNWHLELQS